MLNDDTVVWCCGMRTGVIGFAKVARKAHVGSTVRACDVTPCLPSSVT